MKSLMQSAIVKQFLILGLGMFSICIVGILYANHDQNSLNGQRVLNDNIEAEAPDYGDEFLWGDDDNEDADNEDADNEDTDNEDTDNEDTDNEDTDSGDNTDSDAEDIEEKDE